MSALRRAYVKGMLQTLAGASEVSMESGRIRYQRGMYTAFMFKFAVRKILFRAKSVTRRAHESFSDTRTKFALCITKVLTCLRFRWL